MKKKIIALLVGLFLINNVYAKENTILKCDDANVRLSDYIESSNTPVVLIGKDYSTYYTWNDGKCEYLTSDQMLELYNQKYTINNNITFENNKADQVLTVTKYNYKTIVGYSLNTQDYNKDTQYYYLNKKENAIREFTDEYDKDDEYYVQSYFKHVSSTTLDNSKVYYYLSDPNNSLFEVVDKDKLSSYNILNVYEIVDSKDSLISENKYSMKTSLINELINDKIGTNETASSYMLEIGDKLYLNIVFKKDDESISQAYLYDEDGKLLEKYNNKVFSLTNNYVIAYDKDYKNYYVMNSNLKVLDTIKFEKANVFNSAYSIEDGLYLSLTSDDETITYFYEISSDSVILTILIILGVIFSLGALYFFVLRKKFNIKDLINKIRK